MFRAGKSITTLAVATSLLVASGIVLAQGVGNIGVLPGPIIPMNTPGGWDIGNPATGPIPVVRDPNGPAWRKVLTDPNGQQFPAVPGQVFTLHESLVVAGNLPWSDWHEKINQPFWDWANPSILVNGVVPAGLSIINNPGNAVTGGRLNFLFNSIVPGSLVDIKKDL